MSNHIFDILEQYLARSPRVDTQAPWVLATLVDKEGSSYRSLGAMMMISPEGKAFGGLSGGCLERDIIQQAHKASQLKLAHQVEYDTRDPDDARRLAQTGCRGRIVILFMPVLEALHGHLLEALQHLRQGESAFLQLALQADAVKVSCLQPNYLNSPGYFTVEVKPPKRLFIVGGGYDAKALATMGTQLGWQLSLWDDRLYYAKAADFPSIAPARIFDSPVEQLASAVEHMQLHKNDAFVLMSHHLGKDAAWLSLLKKHLPEVAYIALIGPKLRQSWVRDICREEFSTEIDDAWCEERLFSPAGFDIGGDTPESVALSILAQAHQKLFK